MTWAIIGLSKELSKIGLVASVSVAALMGSLGTSTKRVEVSGNQSPGLFTGDTPLSVEFEGWSPEEPILVMVGHETDLKVEFKNTGDLAGDFFAAVSLRDPEGEWVDIHPLIRVRLEPGERGEASWTYSPGLKGIWDVVYGVWGKY